MMTSTNWPPPISRLGSLVPQNLSELPHHEIIIYVDARAPQREPAPGLFDTLKLVDAFQSLASPNLNRLQRSDDDPLFDLLERIIAEDNLPSGG